MNKYNFKIITLWVIYNNKKEILLGKRSMNEDVYPWYRSIPGGKLEINGKESNQNILEYNIKKEIKEEFWIDVEIVDYLNNHYWYNQSQYKIYITFLTKHTIWKPKPLDDTDMVKYFHIDEIQKIQFPPNVLKTINLAYKKIK
jgi:ADP-ribose pyrophosphatase YjhB (NUDIX family)